MTASDTTTPFRDTWRYKAGLSLIVVGHLILLSALVLPMLGFGLGVGGTLVMVGEGVCLLSIIFLGKDGFLEIKHRIVRSAKEGFEGPVGQGRFRTGICLVVYSTLAIFIVEVLAVYHAIQSTPDSPDPWVLGLSPDAVATSVVWLVGTGEAAFIVAIYVLGGDWWDRFRALFVWRNPVLAGRD